MPERLRRHLRKQLEIHGDGMPLIGADPGFVVTEGIALFAVGSNNLFQHFHRERFPGIQRIYQRGSAHPAFSVHLQVQDFRLMAKRQRNQFTGFFHEFRHVFPFFLPDYIRRSFFGFRDLLPFFFGFSDSITQPPGKFAFYFRKRYRISLPGGKTDPTVPS